MLARYADVTNSSFIGNYYGIVIHRYVTLEDCTFTDNAEGAHLTLGKVRNTTFDGNGQGFYVLKKVQLVSCSASIGRRS